MTTRPPRRRRVEIYFVLYLAALVLLMPDGSERDPEPTGDPTELARLDLQPDRVRLQCLLARDSLSGYVVRSVDSVNVIRYAGNVTGIRLHAVIEDVETGARTEVDEGATSDLFVLDHDAARGAARFTWRPTKLEPVDRTFRVTLTATGTPVAPRGANSGDADVADGASRVSGSTQFVLAMAVDERLGESIVRVESRVDTVVLRQESTTPGQPFGEFWVAPARERIIELPGRRWTNRLSFGGADMARDLASIPRVKASGSDGRAAAGVTVRTDDDGRSIVVDGTSPTTGALRVDVTAQRRDGRTAQTSFTVESTPLAALNVPDVMYPGIEYTVQTRLPDMPGSEVSAVIRDGQSWRIQPTNADVLRFTPLPADTGKTLYVERYVDGQKVSQEPVRIKSYDAPEIVDVRPYADGGKKLVVVRFHGGKDNRPDLTILDGNVGSVQKLHGNLAPASPSQRPTITWIEQFVVSPGDAARPLVFRAQARDKRGATSRVWSEP
jgi:hypothetical protein